MIAIIVPAHDEEVSIGACLRSAMTAAAHPDLDGEIVEVIVVLDACTDATGIVAVRHGARTVSADARNVGLARSIGARLALTRGARWLAFTDADTCVSPNWLAAQLALGADAVCGTIAVEHWGAYGDRMRHHFALTYSDKDGHSHIHGANLGVSAKAYESVGGFQSLESGEDVALVGALVASGANVAWSRVPRVVTSARPRFKAPGGFGATLARIETLGEWVGAPLRAAT